MTPTNLPAAQSKVREITPLDQVRGSLESHDMGLEFAKVLPKHLTPAQFTRVAITALRSNPDLLNADRNSLFQSVMKAAQDGMLLDGRQAALVVYGSKNGPQVQYMPMIGGILFKLHATGKLASISANVVYEADQFEFELGDNERILHRPSLASDRGCRVAVYAIAKMTSGATYREVMSIDDVESVRSRSRAKGGPWTTDYDEMSKKSCIRRLSKRMPSMPELQGMFEADDETYDFSQQQPEPAKATAKATPMSRVKGMLGIATPDPVPVEENPVTTDSPSPSDDEAEVAEIASRLSVAEVAAKMGAQEINPLELLAAMQEAASLEELELMAAQAKGLSTQDKKEARAIYTARKRELQEEGQ